MQAPSPETPLASFHDPEAEEKIGEGVDQGARRQAFRSIRDAIIERARNQRRNPVRRRMGKPEPNGHDREGEPGKRSDWDEVELLVNEIAQQEPTPKNLLDQRNDDCEANETDHNRNPVCGCLAGKDLGVKAVEARSETEKRLGSNPHRENQNRDHGYEKNLPDWAKLILTPEPEEQRAAEYRLSRVDPILRRIEPEGAAQFSEDDAQGQQNKKGHHWQCESRQLPPIRFGTRKICLVFRLNG